MISAERFRQIAYWADELNGSDFEEARRGITEKSFTAGSYICHKGDRLDYWTGVVSGLVKLSAVTESGKSVTLAGLRDGGWFGEGTVLKNEARQYDLVSLRDTDFALMNRATFMKLFETSAAFNKILVRQLNERLGHFIALVEYDRTLGATAKLARSLAWLLNPVLYPRASKTLEITQEELGLLCGLSRQATGQSLRQLQAARLIDFAHNSVQILDDAGLRNFGE